jgi:PKD repeat protein
LIEPTDYICPDSQQVVRVIIANKGLNTQSNIPVFVNITGPTTATISTTYPGPLALGESDTVTVGTFNSWPGGAFNVEAYTAVLNDQSRDNDTLSVTRYINVTPAAPTVVGDTICAGDSTALAAVATGSNYWYDSPIGGTLLQSGDTLNTGPLVSAATYYVESRGTATNSLTTTFANNNSCGGGNMFDVTAIATVTIDSFDLHLQNPGTTSLTEVYYKVGGYTGFETTPGAWTLLGSTNVTSLGTGVATRLVLPSTLTIPAGQTYAIYVFNANVVYTSLGATYTSPEMSITTGVGLCSLFGGTNNPRTWNGRVYYHAEGCASPRTEVSVAVNPAPIVSLADTSGCDQVTLDAGNAGMGYSYNWSTSATTQTIAVTASGTYEVTVSTGLCDAIDASVVTIDPTPVVALGSDMTLCDGGSTVLDAGNAGANFLWNTGDSTQTITVSTAGTYAVGVTSALGCAGADTITIATENSTAGTVSVDTSGCPTVLFTGTSTGGTPDVITWNFGDGGTGTGSNPSHVYTANGVYTVMYVQENECGSDTVTALVTIDCLVGVTAPNGTQVALYPNPTSGLAALAITMPAMGEATIMVTDLHGKIVLQQRQQLDAGSVVLPVDLRAMSAGVYVVHVVTDGLRWQARLVKQ